MSVRKMEMGLIPIFKEKDLETPNTALNSIELCQFFMLDASW